MSDLRESQTESASVVDVRTKAALALIPQIYGHFTFARETFGIIRHLLPSPFTFPRRATNLLHLIIICIATVELLLLAMSGVTSHVVSQAHTVARNARAITSAICELPVANLLCAETRNEVHSPVELNMDHSQPWHPFLINEDLHGPAVDFAIRKAANTTSIVLAFVRASDLPRRHEISDKLKDFLQGAWASELSSATHLSLVRIVIDEMMLETDAIFTKLRADLHPGFLSWLMTFNWARQAEQAGLEALAISADATAAHTRLLVAHGEPVYNGLRFLESIAVDISSLLASETVAVERAKEDMESSVLTFFGGHRNAMRILKGRVAELHRINHFWMEAKVSLSLGIHAFSGVRSDLTALSEHQYGAKTARLHLPAGKQSLNLEGWVKRLDARRVLMPAEMYGH